MPRHEFGLIENIEKEKSYDSYEPEKYNCISIDDDIIQSFVKSMGTMKTYYHNMNRPDFGLAYCGVTIIPPESLIQFQNIILSSKMIRESEEVVELANIISQAINQNKYMIHFGI